MGDDGRGMVVAWSSNDDAARPPARKVGHLVVAGAQTDVCIRSTIHGAFVRGYDVTLVGDAHTTIDLTPFGAPAPEKVIAHTNLYWTWQSAPGRRAAVADTAAVSFVAPPAM